MAVGQSGRIVLEIDPTIKRALHARLSGEGRHLKDWFLEQVEIFLKHQQQVMPWLETPEPPALTAAELVERRRK